MGLDEMIMNKIALAIRAKNMPRGDEARLVALIEEYGAREYGRGHDHGYERGREDGWNAALDAQEQGA